MSKPLIRFAKRLTSWEAQTSDDDLLETEFRTRNHGKPDLRPSVYEIELKDVVQAFAEHATAFHPPASAGGVDLGGTSRPVADTQGETGFTFTMRAHREIVLKDRDDLLNLVREVRGSLETKIHAATREQVRAYARARLVEGDQEWERARDQETAQDWLKKIRV